MVFPWRRFLEGDARGGKASVSACRGACDKLIRSKIIIENGIFPSRIALCDACHAALRGGADFLEILLDDATELGRHCSVGRQRLWRDPTGHGTGLNPRQTALSIRGVAAAK